MRTICTSLVIVLGLCAEGRADEKPLYGPGEKVEGKMLAEWATEYSRLFFAMEKSKNPLLDPDPLKSSEGQKGPVWFLSGTTVRGPEKRSVTVPEGKVLFSPIIYTFTTDYAGPLGKKNVVSLKDRANKFRELSVSLNGKELGDMEDYRAAVSEFTIEGPNDIKVAAHPLLSGKRQVIADGYWFMLRPLPVGEHTLRVKGASPPRDQNDLNNLVIDITYRLKVEKK